MSVTGSYTLTDAERTLLAKVERLRAAAAPSVNGLIAMLGDPSWVVRRAVVSALSTAGAGAVEPLCAILLTQRNDEARLAAAVDALVAVNAPVEPAILRLTSDPNPAVVADAAQVLGRRRSEQAVPVLERLTSHANDNVAVAAIEALGNIGGRAAIEVLIDCVNSRTFFRTFPAIDVLGRSGDPRVVEPLARLLENPQYLPEAARALGRSGERAGAEPLLELLAASSDAVVRVGVAALADLRQRFEEKSGMPAVPIDEMIRARLGSEMIHRLERVMLSADLPEAIALCSILGATASAEAAPLLARALDGPEPLAMSGADALKRIGRDADTQLLHTIREGSSASRKAVLPIASRSNAAAAVAACLTDADPEVRALACETLARLGNPSVVPEIFRLLQDRNLRVVHAATGAIQALGSREARQLAVKAARAESATVRRSALRILTYFGDGDALEPVLDALNDPDPRVREVAVQGLPYLEDKRALEALVSAVKSSDARTRALATRSLGHVPNANARVYSLLIKGLADPDPWVRYYACQSLGRLVYDPAAARVAELLADSAGQVRVAAVEALSHMSSAQAHDALRGAASSEDVEVKRAALVGLGIAHRAGDLPVVLGAANDPDAPTRLMALSAMASFLSPAVLGALSAAASDRDEQVRSAAISFLAARPEQDATEVLLGLLASESVGERAKAALLVPSEGRIAGLLGALEEASDELAPILVSILARLEGPEARSALLATMRLQNVAARKAAAPALAARRDAVAISILQEAAQSDPRQDVRQICSLLLKG